MANEIPSSKNSRKTAVLPFDLRTVLYVVAGLQMARGWGKISTARFVLVMIIAIVIIEVTVRSPIGRWVEKLYASATDDLRKAMKGGK